MIPYPVAYAQKPFSKQLDVISREIAAGGNILESAMMKRINHLISDANVRHIETHKAAFRAMSAASNDRGTRISSELIARTNLRIINELTFAKEYVYFHASGSQIFEFAPKLSAMFAHSSVSEVPTAQVRLPYRCFYLAATTPFKVKSIVAEMGVERTCNGVHCRLEGKLLLLTPTAPPNPDYKDIQIVPAWLHDTDPILQSRIKIDLGRHDTLENAILEALREYEASVAASVALMQTRLTDKNPADAIDVAANHISNSQIADFSKDASQSIDSGAVQNAASTIVAWVANALCYLTAYRETGVSQWAAGTPHDKLAAIQRMKSPAKITKMEKELLWGGYRRVILFDVPEEQTSSETDSKHASPDTHWRRGHWRLQPHGEGLALRKLIWVRPCLVNREKGVIAHGHIYQPTPEEARKREH